MAANFKPQPAAVPDRAPSCGGPTKPQPPASMEETQPTTVLASRRQSLQLTMARPGCQGGSQAQLDSSASLLCKNTHTQAHTHTEAYSLHSWPLGPRASPTVHVLGLAHPRLSEVPPSSAHSQPLHHLLPPKAFLKGSGNQQTNIATTTVP